jgi:hypothetical protein
MQIIYEITAAVRVDLVAEFEEYMKGRHIPDVMATGAFESSTFGRSDTGRYRISYRTNRADLDEYLHAHAPRLRGHVVETFPDGVDLTREEWEIIGGFGK